MNTTSYTELKRARARSDARSLKRLVAIHREYSSLEEEDAERFYYKHARKLGQVWGMDDDPDRGLAYVTFAAESCDDADFLGLVAALCLEQTLRRPSPDIIERAEAEARRSDRFRWLMGGVYPHVV